MYTDDTTIYFNLKDLRFVNREIEINSEIEKVNTWFKLNKLAKYVDASTSKCMFFYKRRAITPLKFSMNNRTIDVVHKFKYLSIMLDANISWKSFRKIVILIFKKKYKIPFKTEIGLLEYTCNTGDKLYDRLNDRTPHSRNTHNIWPDVNTLLSLGDCCISIS